MTLDPGLYHGVVRHTRVKPRKLSLRHRCFWLALDIDRLAETTSKLRVLSYNKNNILSFFDRDHGDGGDLNLRTQIEEILSRGGIYGKPEKIILFCMPRVLGYGFNPISLYFCYGEAGALQAIVYEVHNTFGQRHSYVAQVAGGNGPIIQTANKTFYVSPFMDMELAYKFKLEIRGEQLLLAISARDSAGPVIFTSLKASGKTLTNRSLMLAWIAHPLLTVKVIVAIHFHAARLWIKGMKIRLRPPPPKHAATIGQPGKPS